MFVLGIHLLGCHFRHFWEKCFEFNRIFYCLARHCLFDQTNTHTRTHTSTYQMFLICILHVYPFFGGRKMWKLIFFCCSNQIKLEEMLSCWRISFIFNWVLPNLFCHYIFIFSLKISFFFLFLGHNKLIGKQFDRNKDFLGNFLIIDYLRSSALEWIGILAKGYWEGFLKIFFIGEHLMSRNTVTYRLCG